MKYLSSQAMMIVLLTCPLSFGAAVASFIDVTTDVGLNTSIGKTFGNATWVDVNNDGLLDVVSSRHTRRMNLYLNNGDRTFANTASQSGLYPSGSWDHHGMAWGDYNNDGNIDLLVAEGGNAGAIPAISQLWRENSEGNFENINANAGIGDIGRSTL